MKPRKPPTSAAHRKYKHPSNQPRAYVMRDTFRTKNTKTAAVLPVRDCLEWSFLLPCLDMEEEVVVEEAGFEDDLEPR